MKQKVQKKETITKTWEEWTEKTKKTKGRSSI